MTFTCELGYRKHACSGRSPVIGIIVKTTDSSTDTMDYRLLYEQVISITEFFHEVRWNQTLLQCSEGQQFPSLIYTRFHLANERVMFFHVKTKLFQNFEREK